MGFWYFVIQYMREQNRELTNTPLMLNMTKFSRFKQNKRQTFPSFSIFWQSIEENNHQIRSIEVLGVFVALLQITQIGSYHFKVMTSIRCVRCFKIRIFFELILLYLCISSLIARQTLPKRTPFINEATKSSVCISSINETFVISSFYGSCMRNYTPNGLNGTIKQPSW